METNDKSPAKGNATILIAEVAKRYGITTSKASQLILRFLPREKQHHFGEGWWLELMDAQFQTHIGPYKRIRCGDETQLVYLIPEPGGLCHDCGCAIGEYHVFGCDAEECSNCGEQAFCCDCGDGSEAEPKA